MLYTFLFLLRKKTTCICDLSNEIPTSGVLEYLHVYPERAGPCTNVWNQLNLKLPAMTMVAVEGDVNNLDFSSSLQKNYRFKGIQARFAHGDGETYLLTPA